MAYKCSFCGEMHDDLPMDVAFRKPEDYFKVPEHERAKRIVITEDLCAIDNQTFIIRGIMPVPVKGQKRDFVWGIWVIVDEKEFYRYAALFHVDATREPPMRGWLSATIPGYPPTYMLEADVYLSTAKERPTIVLRETDHPLFKEQDKGITMKRVHEILHTAFPGSLKK